MTDKNDKLIDIALEEYKALRAEIVALIQNRNNLIIFGFAGLVTLISVGATIFSSSLAPLELNKTKVTDYTYVNKRITSADGEINIETTSPYTVTETEQSTKNELIEKDRGTASAIIFIVLIPLFCMYITFHWVRNTRHIFYISKYIANNIETKINIFYLEQDCENRKTDKETLFVMPLNWETFMSAHEFPKDEFQWFIYPYVAISIFSIIGGILISLKASLEIIILVPLFGLGFLFGGFHIRIIRKEQNKLQSYRPPENVNKMPDRIEFKKSAIITWKKPYIDELRGLKELEKEQEKKPETFHQQLQASGLVKQIKQPSYSQQAERKLIEVQDKPVSETIIEERR